MNRTLLLNRNFIHFGIPLALFGVLILLMKSPLLHGNNTLGAAITADLLLTVPLVYVLLIRNSSIPKTTVMPVMVLGLLIGSYFLPKESQTYLELFKNWALPVIELSVLSIVTLKVRKAIQAFKALKSSTPDFYDTLKNVCHEMLPEKLSLLFATEVAVCYYGFIHWKKRAISSNEFTYHKKSGTPALLGVLVLLVGIETSALHFLLVGWSPVFAWVLTVLSLYSAIQLFGFAKALSRRPIAIQADTVALRYGIMNETRIPHADIEAVVLSAKSLEKDKLTKTLSPLGELEGHNVIIHLKRKHTLYGLYGSRKQYKTIALYLDEPDEFKETLEKTLAQGE